jgi:integrase
VHICGGSGCGGRGDFEVGELGVDAFAQGGVELLDQVPPRYRALLLLATFASLRFGELAGLRRGELDLDACSVQVATSTAEMDDGRLIDHDPKSRAGRRVVAFPKEIVPELRWHVERFAQAGDDGLVFIGPKGGRLRRSNFRRIWTKARNAIAMPELHFHDLRHTGNTMAAGQGASLRELMERMGHSSTRAALIYLHATRERDEAIAAGMGKVLREARKKRNAASGTGTQRARGRNRAS